MLGLRKFSVPFYNVIPILQTVLPICLVLVVSGAAAQTADAHVCPHSSSPGSCTSHA